MSKTLRARYDVTTGQVQIEMSLLEWEDLQKTLSDPGVVDEIRESGNGGYHSTASRLIRCFDNLKGSLSRTVEPLDMNSITAWIPGWWVTPDD